MKNNSLAKNSLFFVLYRTLNVIFPLISVSYVSNVIMASGVGKVASAQNMVQYFVLIAGLGIPNYGIREIAKCKEDTNKRDTIFSELFLINACSTAICVTLFYIILFMSNISMGNNALYAVSGLSIVLNFFNVDWFYQGNEEYSYIAIRSFVIKVFSLIAIVLFVRNASDYVMYALIYVFGIAGNNIINCINLRKHNVCFRYSDIEVSKHFRPVFILLCTTIAIELYTMVDTTMLTYMSQSEIVGYYTNSIKIVKIVIMLVAAIGAVLLPRLSYYHSKGMINECSKIVNRVLEIIFFLFVPCGVGIALLADNIVPVLLGNSFLPAVSTLRIAALLIFALGFSNLFGTQVLLTFGDEKRLLLATVFGASSNILLNAILIPMFQQNGAIIASVCSEAIVTMITLVFAKKRLSINIDLSVVIKCFVSALVMSIAIITIKRFMNSNIIILMISISCGAIIYFATSWLMRNPVLIEIKNIRK